MAKTRLMQAVCAVALLAAAPAFAQQTITQPADTGVDNSVQTPVAHEAPTPGSAPMAPAEKMGRPMHHSAMGNHPSGMMHVANGKSQKLTVDQLNNQSYQAAHRGQAFSASNTGSAGAMGSTGSGSMNGMSAASPATTASPATAASGSGGGAGK